MRKFVAVLSVSLFLVAAGWAQTENILNNFNLSNGGYPGGPVILDSSGNVYGMTNQGGTMGCGVVYQLVNSGGTWTENDIYNFTCGADGGNPLTNGLAIDSSENLYGTTPSYGAYGFGVVFELTNSGGNWTLTVLYSFTGDADGAYPSAGVTIDAQGNLYGTAEQGGGGGCSNGCGVVYNLNYAQNLA